MLKKASFMAVICALFISSWAPPRAKAHCGQCGHTSPPRDIVDTAVAAGDFETLVAAVKAAGLVEYLKSPGPLTVFAPTDAAFAKLPKGTVEALLANPDRLAAILKTHVVPGRVPAKDVVRLSSATTVLGQSLLIDTKGGVRVGNANVVKTDIDTSNGVIHVIDTVLMPKNDIIETARTAGSFKTLLAALAAADLTDALRGPGPYTVFAPTDAAFAELPPGTVAGLLSDTPKLASILKYHVVTGKVTASDVIRLREAKTLQGQSIRIDASSGVAINSARVVRADVMAANGVIHVVDEVLLPSLGEESSATSPARQLIEQAISRGAPLYNDGHHAACQAVYEVAAMGLLYSADEMLGAQDRNQLKKALASARRADDATKGAWIMRHALDAAYESATRKMN